MTESQVSNAVHGTVSGPLTQIGTLHGDVNLLTGAPVRTRYRLQVKRIAPPELIDRAGDVPVDLPALWASVGRVNRGETMAASRPSSSSSAPRTATGTPSGRESCSSTLRQRAVANVIRLTRWHAVVEHVIGNDEAAFESVFQEFEAVQD
ncbi:hypothetical protein ACWEIJ_29265 [Lentzea sp. NPDC004789]